MAWKQQSMSDHPSGTDKQPVGCGRKFPLKKTTILAWLLCLFMILVVPTATISPLRKWTNHDDPKKQDYSLEDYREGRALMIATSNNHREIQEDENNVCSNFDHSTTENDERLYGEFYGDPPKSVDNICEQVVDAASAFSCSTNVPVVRTCGNNFPNPDFSALMAEVARCYGTSMCKEIRHGQVSDMGDASDLCYNHNELYMGQMCATPDHGLFVYIEVTSFRYLQGSVYCDVGDFDEMCIHLSQNATELKEGNIPLHPEEYRSALLNDLVALETAEDSSSMGSGAFSRKCGSILQPGVGILAIVVLSSYMYLMM